MSGSDYGRRDELLKEVSAVPEDPSKIRIGETIAAGMAVFDKDRHLSFLSVF